MFGEDIQNTKKAFQSNQILSKTSSKEAEFFAFLLSK